MAVPFPRRAFVVGAHTVVGFRPVAGFYETPGFDLVLATHDNNLSPWRSPPKGLWRQNNSPDLTSNLEPGDLQTLAKAANDFRPTHLFLCVDLTGGTVTLNNIRLLVEQVPSAHHYIVVDVPTYGARPQGTDVAMHT